MRGVLHTKHFVGGLLVAAATISGVVAVDALGHVDRAATATSPARRVDVPDAPPSQFEAVVTLANRERASRGLAPVAWHPAVAAAAQAHSADMAEHRRMSHTGSDGSDAGDRLRRAGFDWTSWGENIAAGFDDPAQVFAAWMASPGHRRQILGDFQYIGVAAVPGPDGRLYWTMDLANGS